MSVKDSGGAWRDLTTYPGQNLVDEATWREDVDSPHMTCEVRLRRDAGLLSLAPLRTGSALNRAFNPANSPAALLALNREIKIETALMPADKSPASGDWMLSFHGRIDSIDSAGEQIVVEGRDLGGALADAWFEKEWTFSAGALSGTPTVPLPLRIWAPSTAYASGEYVIPTVANVNAKFYECTTAGTSGTTEPVWPASSTVADGAGTLVWTYRNTTTDAGFDVEAVIQSMLTALVTSAAVTVSTPTTPDFAVAPFKQDRQPILESIRALSLLYGGDARFKYDSGSGTFKFTVIVLDRAPVSVLRTFYSSEYKDITRLSQDKQNIRNVVDLLYPDVSAPDFTTNPKRLKVHSEDSASITKYGRLWMEIAEAGASQIDTAAEAQAMADAAIDDLCEPTVEHEVEFVHGFPFVELNDYYAFAANDRHYDSTQSLAVVSYEHTASDGSIRTKMGLRGKPTSGRDRWLEASTSVGGENSPHQTELFMGLAPLVLAATPTIGGAKISVAAEPYKNTLPEEYEHHVGPTGFTPSSATLVSVGSKREVEIANLVPGTQYAHRIVPRGRNASKPVIGQPGPETLFTAGRASAGHILSRLDMSRMPLNGGFETQIDDDGLPDYWMQGGAGAITVESDANGSSGAKYVKMINTAGSELILYSALFAARGGRRYTVSVWHKEASAPGTTFDLNFSAYTQAAVEDSVATGHMSNLQSPIPTSTTWAQCAATLLAPADTRFARVRVVIDDAAAKTVYIDGITVEEVCENEESWIAVSGGIGFANSWVNFGSGETDAAYYLDAAGVVHLVGTVKSGTVGYATPMFTLPTGYRPAAQLLFPATANDAFASVRVQANGDVCLAAGSNTWLALSGISFRVA